MSYNKHLDLYQLIDTHKPDIIIGTETHLNKDIDSREIFPPNYVYSPPVRKDQDSGEKRGGVVIAVNSNIISVEQSSCNISHKSGSVVVGSFYRPPSTCVLKEAATEIAPHLSFVFQQSINTGEVPPD